MTRPAHGDCDGDVKCLVATVTGFGDDNYDNDCQKPRGG